MHQCKSYSNDEDMVVWFESQTVQAATLVTSGCVLPCPPSLT
jgi:hypothetical protein